MNITSFIFLLAGWIAVLLAVFTLVSHTSPALDFIHMQTSFGNSSASLGMIVHFVIAIFLAGLAYLLIDASSRM